MQFSRTVLIAAFLLAGCPVAMADCGNGANLGAALQGCVGQTVAVFFDHQNGSSFLSIQGTVVSSSADYLTIDNAGSAPKTSRLVIPFGRILYVQYQF